MSSTALALAAAISLAPAPAAEPEAALVLGDAYPLEFVVSYPGALFHWVDSLAGTSGGKTVPAYREEYVARFGSVSRHDRAALDAFADARAAFVRGAAGGDRGPSRYSRLLSIFLAHEALGPALAGARAESPTSLDALASALQHFEPRYRTIWRDGAGVRAFHDRVRSSGSRAKLARLLARVAAFLDVDPKADPRPRIVAAPVPAGFGTHAEAMGRYLLIEIRPGEGLATQASVIVHENAHFLFERVAPERMRRWQSIASESGREGKASWRILHEALPTALGQGVADRSFRPDGWSRYAPWYHRTDVDAAAKAIYPVVIEALEGGRALDDDLVREMLRLVTLSRGLTPRSP